MSHTYEELQLLNQLNNANIAYDDSTEGLIIANFGAGDHIDDINCYISVNKLDSGVVAVNVNYFDLFNFGSNLNGYVACNKANDDALVAKFYIDDEGDAIGALTMLYRDDFSEEFAKQLVDTLENFALDMDDAYPFFEEAL